jgi:hypothetical protein
MPYKNKGMSKLCIILFLLGCANATASETLLNGPDIQLLLADVVLYGELNGQPIDQIFQKSGVTFYNSGGGQSQGSWNVTGDQFCSVWPPNPTWACFDVTRDGDKITFIAKSGKRFEMRLTK